MVEPNTVDLRENPFAQQALQFASKNKVVDQAKLGADVQKAAKTDSAPSAQAQTQTVPLASLNQLLSKFDVQRIPISRLRLMRRDPMIAFALFFIQAQLLRARWSIKCPDAQVAAFVDNALREIWPSLVMNYMNKLTFGWQAAVKRFALTNPDWTYIDSNNPNATESPVWDNGTIQAVTWKPFVPLPPEGAEPNWDDNGDFNGIKYNPGLVQTSGGSPPKGDPIDYDVLHCSPGDELVLTTNRGYVPIADLDDAKDKLVVWDKKQKRIARHKGFEFTKGSRNYAGDLISVHAGDSVARVTPNHKFTVRWNEEARSKHAVYLMRKGDWWRIGITRVAREESKSSGLGIRLSAEGGDAAWVLGMFDSKNEALFYERLWGQQYQIPDMVFQTSKWAYSSQSEHCLTTEQIESIWSQIDSASGALRLLDDLKLDAQYPFMSSGETSPRGTRGWTCNAVNMIAGCMEVPVDNGSVRADWKTIDIEHEDFQGEVFSIDVPPYHHYVSNGVVTQNSLWFTNERESVHGSLWGYPRIGYAYRFWWSFWFNWGLADRHFEKDADPPTIVRYPPGRTLADKDGQQRDSRAMALLIGNQARSNSTIAMPSDVVVDDQGMAKNTFEWSIEFLKGGGNFDVFEKRFAQLQTMILRSCMVPEEAFQAKGGSAGYNSTGQLQEAFQSSQITLMQELDMDVNRYVIPQLVAANFSDRNVKAVKVTAGFDVEDIDLAKSIIQGAANSDVQQLDIDMRHLLDAVGLPVLSPAAIQQKAQEKQAALDAQAQAMKPDPQAPVPGQNGQAGVTKQGLYYDARESINLDDSKKTREALFLAELMAVGSLHDHVVLGEARALRGVWAEVIKRDFDDAAMLLTDYQGSHLGLDETFFERWQRRASERVHEAVTQTRRVLATVMRRGSTIEFERAGLTDFSWDPQNSQLASEYLRQRGLVLVDDITTTTRNEIKTLLSDLVARNVAPEHIPSLVRAHFEFFSEWRADRLVRTEIVSAYNYATLYAGLDHNIEQAQAIDAQLGPSRSDPECIDRNGRVFPLAEAIIEQGKEHPQGTLQWVLLKTPTDQERLPVPDVTLRPGTAGLLPG